MTWTELCEPRARGQIANHIVINFFEKYFLYQNKHCLTEIEPAILCAQETLWRLEKSEKALDKALPKVQFDTRPVIEQVRQHFLQLHSKLQARWLWNKIFLCCDKILCELTITRCIILQLANYIHCLWYCFLKLWGNFSNMIHYQYFFFIREEQIIDEIQQLAENSTKPFQDMVS